MAPLLLVIRVTAFPPLMAEASPSVDRQARGFTLVELVVVLMLMAALAIAVVPRLSSPSGFDERGFHDQALAALQYARKIAVASRRHVCATADATGIAFQRDRDAPETVAGVPSCEDALALPASNAGCGANKVCPPAGVTLSSVATFRFDPLGRASAAVTLTVSGQPAITIDQETGYVR